MPVKYLIYLNIYYCSLFLISAVFSKTYIGNQDNYINYRNKLIAGDTLILNPGEYLKGLHLIDKNGTNNKKIVITAKIPHSAILVARSSSNTIDLKNSSYIVIKNLKFNGKHYSGIDAIKANGSNDLDYTHNIIIENNIIEDHDGSQNTVGINTKITSWDWIIRKNIIKNTGTGMYFGDSNGEKPFIRGIIENNLIIYPLGYCMQIKHQNSRPNLEDIPNGNVITIIRNNIFAKDDKKSPSGDRPNLLVSGTFSKGEGSEDRYEIYGNFFFYNPREYLFQGSGNISLHNNIFVDSKQGAINIREHHSRKPKEIFVYCNTIYECNSGIILYHPDTNYEQIFTGNAIFSNIPFKGIEGFLDKNKIGKSADAVSVFNSPSINVINMDFFPKKDKLGANIDLTRFNKDISFNKDFNGNIQSGKFYGSYSGEGKNTGWKLSITEIKNDKDDNKIIKTTKKKAQLPLYKMDHLYNIICFNKSIIPIIAEIYNLKGYRIKKIYFNAENRGDSSIILDLSILSKGLYIIKLDYGNLYSGNSIVTVYLSY